MFAFQIFQIYPKMYVNNWHLDIILLENCSFMNIALVLGCLFSTSLFTSSRLNSFVRPSFFVNEVWITGILCEWWMGSGVGTRDSNNSRGFRENIVFHSSLWNFLEVWVLWRINCDEQNVFIFISNRFFPLLSFVNNIMAIQVILMKA